MNPKILLLADGDALPKSQLSHLRKGRFCVAIDGAADQAKKERWIPDLILGDFDTVKPSTLTYFAKKKVTLLSTPDQNYTDLEKALGWAVAQNAKSIWVAQALGKRLDHTLANLSFLRRFHKPEREIFFFTSQERIQFLADGKFTLKGKPGRGFAVIPFPGCNVTSQGLAFEMKELSLELGFKESVSNQAKRAKIELEIKGQCLVIEEHKIK